MHYLHCILVGFREGSEGDEETARNLAEQAIEHYGNGLVWDWYDTDGAGRWADAYPGSGVVLGSEEPKRFLDLFNEHKESPLQNARESLMFVLWEKLGWRNVSEIESDGMEVVDTPRNPTGDQASDPSARFWSGRFIPPASRVIDQEFIDRAWRAEPEHRMFFYHIKNILQLVYGEYISDSHFYSAPDGSSRVFEDVVKDVRTHPEKYALVFMDLHN